ncbi:MAG: condensation domain-containing protein [Methanospirillum sp.]|nr:condensation domain-containing protein [Methanospirillum sp.]
MDGPVLYDILEKAVDDATLAEPITRCKIIKDQDALFWQECSTKPTHDYLLRLSSRTPEKILYQALSYPLDPYLGRLFQIILIENPDKTGDIVVFNVHHIVMDAQGLKVFSELILRYYSEYLSGHPPELFIIPIRDHQLPRISDLLTEKKQIQKPETSIGWCSRISVPLQSLHVENYRYSMVCFNQRRTSIIQDCRRKWDITVNDFMIAILARAITSVLHVKSDITVPLYNTVDLRRYLPITLKRSLINFSTSFEVRVPIMPGESLEHTGKRVHLLMNQKKSQYPGLDEVIEAEKQLESGYSAAKELINSAWNTIQDTASKTTIFSNTGIITRKQVTLCGLSVRNAYILPSFFLPPGFFFLLSTFESIMTLSATYAVPAYDPDLINMMFNCIDQEIPGYAMHPGVYSIIK